MFCFNICRQASGILTQKFTFETLNEWILDIVYEIDDRREEGEEERVSEWCQLRFLEPFYA